MKNTLQAVFLALTLIAIAQAVWQHGRLPEKVATHFDLSGRANGWMSRGTHTAWHLGTVLFLAALIEGIVVIDRRLPKEFINIPHRDYWLAPERAAATRAWVAGCVLLIGCEAMVFMLALFHLVSRANVITPPRLGDEFWWCTGGFLAVLMAPIVALLAKFGRKPAV